MAAIYDAKTFQPREGVGFSLGRARKTFILALEKELAPYDISSSQWAVILNIADGRAATAGELCKAMRYDPGGMTRLLDRLETKGFLRRVRDEHDRRTVHLELTASGKALRPRIIEALVRVLNQLLRGFTRSEVRQLQDMLGRIIANG
jgi:DNA-binding MarR family transcriptional regulator